MAEEPRQPPRAPIVMMAFHAVLAGTLFYLFNRFMLSQTVEMSLIWACAAAPFAATLAYQQGRR
jgi:hypothetical protein